MENKKRWRTLKKKYDPIKGENTAISRAAIALDDNTTINIPKSMFREDLIKGIQKYGTLLEVSKKISMPYDILLDALIKLRTKYDYEFWAATCVTIETKKQGLQKFVLNRPQRKVLKILEDMRLSGKPIRMILLKARQWGGSTLVQLYIAWIQLFHKTNWHAIIVADKKDKSHHIRAMYDRMIKYHPIEIFDSKIELRPYQNMYNFREISNRDCIIGVTSVENPDMPRAFTFQLLHLSEVGQWKSTAQVNAENLIASLEGALVDAPYTVCVKESTAYGVGNYFHKAWQKAVRGESNDKSVFVSWFEDGEQYWDKIDDYNNFIENMDTYDKYLWECGATLEHIAWYKRRRRDFPSDWKMKQEFPSTPDEAFQSTGSRAIPADYVKKAVKYCKPPILIGNLYADAMKKEGAFDNIRFVPNDKGYLKIWVKPNGLGIEREGKKYTNRYCAFADVGGRSERSDYSCITVLDRILTMFGGVPYVCAEWHGHIDQDLFAWEAARLCYWYDKALLAIEVNSLRRDSGDAIRGYEPEHSYTVLDEIKLYYPNLYYRIKPQTVKEYWDGVVGFHTNIQTKPMIIDALIAALRDEGYEERNIEAIKEFEYYEIKPGGNYGAVEGEYDDRLISRAGAIWLSQQMPIVSEVDKVQIAKLKIGHHSVFY